MNIIDMVMVDNVMGETFGIEKGTSKPKPQPKPQKEEK